MKEKQSIRQQLPFDAADRDLFATGPSAGSMAAAFFLALAGGRLVEPGALRLPAIKARVVVAVTQVGQRRTEIRRKKDDQ